MWFLCVLIASILCYLIYKSTSRPANFPTGPWNLPIVGYLPFMGQHPYLTFRDVSKKYGPMFSINIGSHRAIVLSSYELVRDALKEETFAGRPPFPAFKFRADDKGVIFSTGRNWQEMRRFMLRTLRDFGMGKSSLEIVIQGEIRELIESLKRDVGKPVKLHNTFNLAIVNALWTITTGQRFDLEDRKVKPILQLFSKFISEGGSARFSELIPLVHKVRGISSVLLNFVNEAKSMFKDVIAKHKQEHKEGDVSDFLHVFLDKMEQDERKERSTPFTGEEGMANLLASTFDLFSAGSETTSTTLLWLFLLISLHPEIQDKLQEELDGIVGKERLPSMSDKSNLPYTEAVLLECQRFASLLPLNVPHSATDDTRFKGYSIPKGTIVIPNLYQVMRDPQTWENPEEFYPEHFLTKNGQVKHVEQLIPFSIGKRVCPGESLAKVELFLFATSLLQHFKFTLPAGQPKPSLVPPPSMIICPQPFDIILTLRN